MDSIELLRMLADYCTTYIRTYVVPSGFSQDRWQVYLLCFNSEFATNSCAYIFLFLQIKWQAVFFFSFALDDACETEIKGEHGWMYRQKEEKERSGGKRMEGSRTKYIFFFFVDPGSWMMEILAKDAISRSLPFFACVRVPPFFFFSGKSWAKLWNWVLKFLESRILHAAINWKHF